MSTTENYDMENSTEVSYSDLNDTYSSIFEDVPSPPSIDYPDKYVDSDDKLFTTSQSIFIYTFCIASSILLTTLRSLVFFKVCMNASKGLHDKMFNNILQATMRFFDTNPSG